MVRLIFVLAMIDHFVPRLVLWLSILVILFCLAL